MNVMGMNIIAKSTWLRKQNRIVLLTAILVFWGLAHSDSDAQEQNAADRWSVSSEQIVEAFAESHDGFSSDELLIRDELRNEFFRILGIKSNPKESETRKVESDALLRLLKLRKTGKLKIRATRRGESVDSEILPIAEIAARVVSDRHRISSDSMLADPVFRAELQQEAELIQPGVEAYGIRKAVLALRKMRALKPELVLRVADWDRRIDTFSLSELKTAIATKQLPKQPGIYLFRNSEGYLYIGEATDLSTRLATHLGGSDRKSLADVLAGEDSDEVTVELHVFPPDSPAGKLTVRRAYESELIRSREPKFNVRP